MADLSDVENAIVALIAPLIYPNGTGQPSAVLNDSGSPLAVKIFRGWPVPATLDSDLAAGTANISIFSRGTGKNTTRWPIDYNDINEPSPTVSVTVNNSVATNQITTSGAGSANVTQYVTVNIGGRYAVSYPVLATDTAATIATQLASQITGLGFTASSSGPSISVASSIYLQAFVGVAVPQLAEVRRQIESIQIDLWCPTPTTRDNIAKAIEPTLANTVFLTLADSSAARFRYNGTWVGDEKQTVQLYRRANIYDVEYATTLPDNAYEVTAPTLSTAFGADNIPATQAVPVLTQVYPLPPTLNEGNFPVFQAEQGNS